MPKGKEDRRQTDIELDKTPEPAKVERDIGPAVGNQNEAAISRRNAIADQYDEARAEELVEPDGGPVVEPVEEPDKADGEDDTQVIEQPKKFKVPVNGKMLELTEDELIARASKIEAADEYLRLASESVKKAATTALSSDETVSEEVDFRALAKALQVGTEEEAEQALRDLATKVAAKPSKTPDVSQVVDERLALREAMAKFEDEFKDVLSDKYLKQLVWDRDSELSQTDKDTPYDQRWRKAATEVRDWAKGFKTLPTDKATRKAQNAPVPSAAGRQQTTGEDEGDDDPRTVIAKIAEKRGQGRVAS